MGDGQFKANKTFVVDLKEKRVYRHTVLRMVSYWSWC